MTQIANLDFGTKKMSTQNIIIFFVIGFLVCFSISGCNRTRIDMDSFGTVVEELPNLPEASEPYAYPETYEPVKPRGMF